MRYTTLGQAIEWIAEPLGAANADDPCLVGRANEIRNLFINLLVDVQLASDAVECFELQRFRSPCPGCAREYCGVSLPYGCHSAIGHLWRDGLLAPLDRWRFYAEPLYSFLPYPDWARSYLRWSEQWRAIAATFPTERDIQSTPDTRLKVIARACADAGKAVRLKFRDRNGTLHEEELKLGSDWTVTSHAASQLEKPGGVVFADKREGRVVLAEEATGNVLSIYEASEMVPSYKRIVPLHALDGQRFVELRLRREWVPLTDPLAVVETGNLNAWQEAAGYLRLHKKSNRDPNDRANSQEHLELARQFLLGERRREQEENLVQFTVQGGLPRGSGLAARRGFY